VENAGSRRGRRNSAALGDLERCEPVQPHLLHGRRRQPEGALGVVGDDPVVEDVEEDVLGEVRLREYPLRSLRSSA
jgi:hypothetical protein